VAVCAHGERRRRGPGRCRSCTPRVAGRAPRCGTSRTSARRMRCAWRRSRRCEGSVWLWGSRARLWPGLRGVAGRRVLVVGRLRSRVVADGVTCGRARHATSFGVRGAAGGDDGVTDYWCMARIVETDQQLDSFSAGGRGAGFDPPAYATLSASARVRERVLAQKLAPAWRPHR